MSPKKPRVLLVLLLLIALVAAGCGGSDDAGTADGSGSDGSGASGDASGEYTDYSDPADLKEQDFVGTFDLDPAALNANPVTPADFTVAPRGEREVAPDITPVIDTCAALSGAELSSIVEAASERDGFGGEYSFDDGTPNGAACTYAFDTHRLRVIIGSSGQVNSDPNNGAVMVPIMGEVTGTPWSDNSAVTLFSEDSFDLDTEFAAHYAAGDYGVVVNNSGGTGIDFATDGALFGEIAVAAAEGAASAPAPAAADDGPGVITTANICGLYTQTELEAFVGIHLGEATSISDTGMEACTWSDDNPTSRNVRIDAGAPGELYVPIQSAVAGDSGQVVIDPLNSPSDAYVEVDGIAFSVSVYAWDAEGVPTPDGTDAAVAIAENLVSRMGIDAQ